MIVLYILLAIVVLMLLVLVHELGHYTAGKIFKFKINEFSIGFGKAIFKRTNKKTGEQFSIRLVPLGGYCSFDGEDEDGESPTSFNKQAWWKRLIVLFFGPLFNIIFGLITVFIMLMVVGYGKYQVTEVDSLNSNVLQKGDVIWELEGDELSLLQESFSQQIQKYEDGSTITITILRDGKKQNVDVVIEKRQVKNEAGEVIVDENNNPVMRNEIGVHIQNYKYTFVQALGQCWVVTGDIIWETLRAFGLLITGQLSIKNVSGPFGIIGGIATGASQSLLILFAFIPLISLNLGIFNLLPIPALDGARMVFVLIEAIRRKPISRKVEGYIHGVGLIVLFTLVVLVDVVKLFI